MKREFFQRPSDVRSVVEHFLDLSAHYCFGHPLEVVRRGFRYVCVWKATGREIKGGAPRSLHCPGCGLRRTETGHDPCIANLPGVRFACCGHGVAGGYLVFEDGTVIRGVFAVERAKHEFVD